MRPKIGFLGTGVMGAPMIRKLLHAGFAVTAWNRTVTKLAPLITLGATACTTPQEAAEDVELLLMCLTDSTAVEAALFGPGGAAHAQKPPGLVVDFSTIGPQPTLQLAERLRRANGAGWVDAPVSGGAQGAENGRLVILGGGESADMARAEPVFDALSQRFTHIGPLGSGQTLKLCNQLIVSTNLLAIAEALALARAAGLDLARVPDSLAGGFADSLPLQIFGRRMAQGVNEPVLGEVGLMLKDLRVASELARSTRQPVPLASKAVELYENAVSLGIGQKDLAELMRLYDPAPDWVTPARKEP
jgi:3-hydroxyisobutyrate dehydrogenase